MIKSTNTTLTTTAAAVIPAHPANRWLLLHAKGTLFLGGSDVTTANGYRMDNGDKISLELDANETLYGITSAATSDISVLYNI